MKYKPSQLFKDFLKKLKKEFSLSIKLETTGIVPSFSVKQEGTLFSDIVWDMFMFSIQIGEDKFAQSEIMMMITEIYICIDVLENESSLTLIDIEKYETVGIHITWDERNARYDFNCREFEYMKLLYDEDILTCEVKGIDINLIANDLKYLSYELEKNLIIIEKLNKHLVD